MLLWTAQQIALNQIDAHLGQHCQFFRQLDTFGDHLRPRGLGDLQYRTDELAFECILMNTVDEVPVDFHVIGSQFRPQAQTRIARP
ncbi:hypothetical protein D3C87_1899950 [compost metagenome]